MKNFNLPNLSVNLMLYIKITALLFVISFCAATLGIALKNKQKKANFVVKTPYAYGKKLASIINDLKAKLWVNGVYNHPSAIAANSKTIIIDNNIYAILSTIKTGWEKNTSNITADAFSKHLAGLKKKIFFIIRIHPNTNANLDTFFTIEETWDSKGVAHYVLLHPNPKVKKGVGIAKQDLFNGHIKNGAALTAWHFAKIADTGSVKTDGTDADFAVSIDPKTGVVIMLNKAEITKDGLKIEIDNVDIVTTL